LASEKLSISATERHKRGRGHGSISRVEFNLEGEGDGSKSQDDERFPVQTNLTTLTEANENFTSNKGDFINIGLSSKVFARCFLFSKYFIEF
jgi:hypothetical protein